MTEAINQGLELLAKRLPALTFEDLPELADVQSCPVGTFDDWCQITPIQLLSAQKPEISYFEREAKDEISHLEQVFDNPKARLIRCEERIRIERVSRFRPRALTQLANRSEDWESRTIAGVHPKRLLSELSDDEYDRLEHRVAVVLVQRLAEYLNKRCRELNHLLGELRGLQETDEGQSWHWRRTRAYSLFTNPQQDKFTNQFEEELKILQSLYRRIKRLQGTKLFTMIPKQLKSSYQPTNLFTYDPHYRGVARLWLAQLNTTVVRTAAEQREAEATFARAFSDYCFLLVQRAFEQMKFRIVGNPYGKASSIDGWIKGWKFTHQLGGNMQLVNPAGQTVLTIIPWSNSLRRIPPDQLEQTFRDQAPTRSSLEPQIVVMHLALEGAAPSEAGVELRQDETKPRLPFGAVGVSPQHIFSVERIARAISWTVLSATYINWKKIDEDTLKHCPVCTQVGVIEPRGEDFEARCPHCKTKWGTRWDGAGKRYPVLIPNNKGEVTDLRSLEQLFGRDVLTPPLDGTLPNQKFKVTT